MKSVRVTVDEVADLVCPFTGRPLAVYMHVGTGGITFSAPDAFCAQEPTESYDILVDRLSMRNGVAGSVTGGDVMKDPYSGQSFQFRDLPDGRVAVCGGFNPRAAKMSLSEFIYFASMRNGRTNVEPPGPQIVATRVSEKPVTARCSDGPSDELKEACLDGVLESGMGKPTVVSMSVKRRGGHGR